ncbi:hypothetical protein EBR03_10335 [bacterium]|nr:hypothetical protein [bacterium]
MSNIAEEMFGQPPKNMTEEIFTSRPDRAAVGDPPPIPDLIKNLYMDTTAWAKDGFKTGNQEEVSRRLAICGECEFFKGGRCMVCGCFMALKAKLSTGKCPKEKW